MRKLYCLIIFVSFMSVVACKETGNKVDGLATNDSVQVADTLFADRVVQNAEQNEEKENLALGGKGDIKNRNMESMFLPLQK